ncbi:PIN domain-containing protein [Xanthomonas campestris pv. campestris]|uniref:DUF4411 family protein n=1 Tax=Xanthomonas campestris pv. campestris (strain ATCC 33913 / DSM 3586 / NCPPB 528 / LMG 568 / P 25) TaxID=190485 RepID=Q8P6K1_XANCP|nr:PIN domain-containing protein [Xanthomonas campestris]AAM42238.1 conserved hypothetical protein [Xanthomonas campestris pv. campestris str. ATCC 33913]MCC5075642.1 DUF4411 family protein [Xanthomonas campestris pv. campestris]MEB1048153.1 DUF4411 family protein [Xanthomonas campestris pv. campestris]
MYVFDTGPFSRLKHYYPAVFHSFWAHMDALVHGGYLLSTREVKRELDNGEPNAVVSAWIGQHAGLFSMPSAGEMQLVAQILAIPHFQSIIGERQRLKGTPVADPFVIAAAQVRGFAVVTTEVYKPQAAKVPIICQHFNVRCIDLEQFMAEQKMTY